MPNISTENINTLAQAVASIGDGDYIYILKSGASSFARIELNLFIQALGEISGSGSGSIDADTYAVIQGNVNTVAAKVDELLGKLANLAFDEDKPDVIGDLSWDSSGGDEPSVRPVLTSPAINTTVNIGQIASDGTNVSKTIVVKGSGLTKNFNISASGTGFSVAPSTLSYADVNNGTSVTVTYTNTGTGDGTTKFGSLSISSDEVSRSVSLKASKAAEGVTYHNIIGSFTHCQMNGLPATVADGGSFSGTLVADDGYDLPSDITVNGSCTKSYNAGVLSLTNITSDITLSATAQPSEIPSGDYVSNGLVLNLDGTDRGGTSGHWIDKVEGYDFTLGSGATEKSNGVQFDAANEWGTCNDATLLSLLPSYTEGTIEIVFTSLSGFSNTLRTLVKPSESGKIGAAIATQGTKFCYGVDSSSSELARTLVSAVSDPSLHIISANAARLVQNQTVSTAAVTTANVLPNRLSALLVGGATVLGSNDTFAMAVIHSVRIYDRQLSESEMLHNQALDLAKYGN